MRVVREKGRNTYKGMVKIDFLATTVKARGQWKNLFKMLRESHCQPRIGYPAKLSFKTKRKRRTFGKKPKKQKTGSFYQQETYSKVTSKRFSLRKRKRYQRMV